MMLHTTKKLSKKFNKAIRHHVFEANQYKRDYNNYDKKKMQVDREFIWVQCNQEQACAFAIEKLGHLLGLNCMIEGMK